MKDILVGSTGFVGSNLKLQHDFEGLFHSTDISNAYGLEPELCIYAGVTSSMVLANSNPKLDEDVIITAFENIKKINPKKLVLISTIAVYDETNGKNEKSTINKSKTSIYGKNRLMLEELVRKEYPNALMIRLPA